MNEKKNSASTKAQNDARLIYVVDDKPMLLELAAVILQPLGYSVKSFSDAASALESFKSAKPFPILLITDYSMHAMNNIDLIKACHQIQPQQKILLISNTINE